MPMHFSFTISVLHGHWNEVCIINMIQFGKIDFSIEKFTHTMHYENDWNEELRVKLKQQFHSFIWTNKRYD